ncbi:hypothetical protein AVEN_197311-1 [Araneus ventricosus]|uniref:Uncharacterized protein n=1 Tax=Araneus ventricosus TaxID=182803 RepID=A0A4Y2EYG3_ARAVE|nr:hypothetical protein AVEN_197311-1 [Araneus ventricosus]
MSVNFSCPVNCPTRDLKSPGPTLEPSKKKKQGGQQSRPQAKTSPKPPNQPKPPVQLKPRQDVPTIIVKPVAESVASSAILKTMLEEKISPRNLGVKTLNCQEANGKGVIIRTETIEMAKKLETEINTHSEPRIFCSAREPRK